MVNRSFSPTTLTIFEEVLKQVSSPPYHFRPADIVDELGISRQQVSNTLSKLVGDGLLERNRAVYKIPEGGLPTLIEFVLGANNRTENPGARLHSVESIFTPQDVTQLKTITNAVLAAQNEKRDGYVTAKQEWIDRLEQAHTALKKELKYLRNHSRSTTKVDDEEIEVVLDELNG